MSFNFFGGGGFNFGNPQNIMSPQMGNSGGLQGMIMQRLGIQPNVNIPQKAPFVGGAVGNYGGGIKQAFNQGAMQGQGMLGKPITGLANVGNKFMTDAASMVSGTPNFNQIQNKGIGSFTPEVRHNMLTRAAAPSMMKENLTKGLDINQSLTPGKETTLDAIPHTLKGGGQITGEQARTFLNEYSTRPIVGGSVRKFLIDNPNEQQMFDFIKNNF